MAVISKCLGIRLPLNLYFIYFYPILGVPNVTLPESINQSPISTCTYAVTQKLYLEIKATNKADLITDGWASPFEIYFINSDTDKNYDYHIQITTSRHCLAL